MSLAISMPIADKSYCVANQKVIGISKYRGYWKYLFKIGALQSTDGTVFSKLVCVDAEQDIASVLVSRNLRKKAFGNSPAERDGLTLFELIEVLELIDWALEREAAGGTKPA